jgi:molybdate transport system regulatory protein
MEKPRLKVKAQIVVGEDIAIGPGKAALLEAIAAHGSISAAARMIGMSYRRAWLLVAVMNRAFAGPLVDTAAGGRRGGGAHLTRQGEALLAAYRGLATRLAEAAAAAPEAAILLDAIGAPD